MQLDIHINFVDTFILFSFYLFHYEVACYAGIIEDKVSLL
jgi:hypothetical protein